MERIRTLIDKEWAEAFKNKMVLGTSWSLCPSSSCCCRCFRLALMRDIPASEMNDVPPAITGSRASCKTSRPAECMQGFLVNEFLLVVPADPAGCAGHDRLVQHRRREVHALAGTAAWLRRLRRPRSSSAKGWPRLFPAIGATWLAFVIFLIGARFFVGERSRLCAVHESDVVRGHALVAPLYDGALRQCRHHHLVARQRSARRRADRHAGHAAHPAALLWLDLRSSSR